MKKESFIKIKLSIALEFILTANPVLLNYYKNLCSRKPKKVAICAVMHKLINHFFAILRDQKPFEQRLPEIHEKLYKQSILKTVI